MADFNFSCILMSIKSEGQMSHSQYLSRFESEPKLPSEDWLLFELCCSIEIVCKEAALCAAVSAKHAWPNIVTALWSSWSYLFTYLFIHSLQRAQSACKSSGAPQGSLFYSVSSVLHLLSSSSGAQQVCAASHLIQRRMNSYYYWL